jgi:hypothetical protein
MQRSASTAGSRASGRAFEQRDVLPPKPIDMSAGLAQHLAGQVEPDQSPARPNACLDGLE